MGRSVIAVGDESSRWRSGLFWTSGSSAGMGIPGSVPPRPIAGAGAAAGDATTLATAVSASAVTAVTFSLSSHPSGETSCVSDAGCTSGGAATGATFGGRGETGRPTGGTGGAARGADGACGRTRPAGGRGAPGRARDSDTPQASLIRGSDGRG